MISIIFIIASFILGYTIGLTFSKYKNTRLMRESFIMGYRECNKKWVNRNAEEARKRMERRKIKNETGSR